MSLVTIIVGPMYSGKSSELLRYLERASIGKKKVCLVRPRLDNRKFFSHSVSTQTLYNKIEIPIIYYPLAESVSDYDVIGIDECQFIYDLDEFVRFLIKQNKTVYMSGLLATSESVIFDPIKNVLPYCDEIVKLNAVCVECSNDIGNYTRYKEGNKKHNVEIGGADKYDAVCAQCYFKGIK